MGTREFNVQCNPAIESDVFDTVVDRALKLIADRHQKKLNELKDGIKSIFEKSLGENFNKLMDGGAVSKFEQLPKALKADIIRQATEFPDAFGISLNQSVRVALAGAYISAPMDGRRTMFQVRLDKGSEGSDGTSFGVNHAWEFGELVIRG